MPNYRRSALLVTALATFSLLGCAASPSTPAAPPAEPEVELEQEVDAQENADETNGAPGGETSIPTGARAASADFPFPVPADWAELDPFVEEKVGKDITMYGAVEYPGDAKTAAAHYRELLIAAGFDAYPYAPGELTNQASLAAEGVVDGEMRLAIINFDVHADGSQRASIHVSPR